MGYIHQWSTLRFLCNATQNATKSHLVYQRLEFKMNGVSGVNDEEDDGDYVPAVDPPDIISAQVLGGIKVG